MLTCIRHQVDNKQKVFEICHTSKHEAVKEVCLGINLAI